MIQLVIALFMLAGVWMMFQKMGRMGWEGIVPLYNTYLVCQILYGNGWKMLGYLIPFYNIYWAFRVNIDLAHAFNQGTAFGAGMTCLPMVFLPILGFSDNMVFGDGSQGMDSDDFITSTLEKFTRKVNGEESGENEEENEPVRPEADAGTEPVQEPERHNSETLALLEQLSELHKSGILTDEEFAAKKAELLKRI